MDNRRVDKLAPDCPTPEQVQKFLRLIEEGRISKRDMECVLRKYSQSLLPSKTEVAKEILGPNFFSYMDWMALLHIQSSLGRQPKFPWDRNILESPCPFNPGKLIKDTHVVFPGLECFNNELLTINKLAELANTSAPLFFRQNKKLDIYIGNGKLKDDFHIKMMTLSSRRWYLVLKEAVPESMGKDPDGYILPPDYESSSTIAEFAKNILIFLRTGTCPNDCIRVVCSGRTVEGNLLCVESMRKGILLFYNNGFDPRTGIGASRKLP